MEFDGLRQSLVLTNLISKYPRQNYLADRIFPALGVNTFKGSIVSRDPKHSNLLLQDDVRAPGSAPKPRYRGEGSKIDFSIRDHAFQDSLPVEVEADSGLTQVENESAVALMLDEDLTLHREVALKSLIVNTLTTAGNILTPSTKWNASGGKPFEDLRTSIYTASKNAGKKINAMVIPANVVDVILEDAKAQGRIQYTSTVDKNNTTTENQEWLLKNIFRLDEVIISDFQRYNSGAKDGTANLTDIWSNMIVLFVKEQPSTNYAGFGLQFVINGTAFTSTARTGVQRQFVNGKYVDMKFDEESNATKFFAHWYYQDKIINPSSGYLINAPLT